MKEGFAMVNEKGGLYWIVSEVSTCMNESMKGFCAGPSRVNLFVRTVLFSFASGWSYAAVSVVSV